MFCVRWICLEARKGCGSPEEVEAQKPRPQSSGSWKSKHPTFLRESEENGHGSNVIPKHWNIRQRGTGVQRRNEDPIPFAKARARQLQPDVPVLVRDRGRGPTGGGRASSTSPTRYRHRSWGLPPSARTAGANRPGSTQLGA